MNKIASIFVLVFILFINLASVRSLIDGRSANEVSVALPFPVAHAIDVIYSTYGDKVDIKPKTLAKFGQNELVGTSFATLMTLPSGVLNETYVTTNVINKISSSSGSDTGTVTLEGHTCSGGVPTTFVVQSVTLVGQTETTIGTALCRITRVYNTSSTDWAGQIYVYEDDTVSSGVPQTDAKIHMISPPSALGRNQSFKAATSLSAQDYWIITGIRIGVDKKTSASVDVELQIRESGGVFRTQFEIPIATTSNSSISVILDPPIIAPKSSDVRIRARASTSNVSVSGRIAGYLAVVRD